MVFHVLRSRSVRTSNKSIRIQQGSSSLTEITMDSTQRVVSPQNVLVEGVNITCLILATKWLTKNVARNPSAGQFISWIMLMQFLSYSYMLGSGYFKKKEIKCRWLPYSLEFFPGTILFLFYCFHSSVHTLVSNIFVRVDLWHLTGSPEVRRSILIFFLGQTPLKK